MFMSKFNFIATEIPGVIIIEPTVFGDSRGYFMETYQAEEFAAAGIPATLYQDNQCKSTRGGCAGALQKEHTQGKTVRVVSARCSTCGGPAARTARLRQMGGGRSLRKIRSSFISRRALPTAFWC